MLRRNTKPALGGTVRIGIARLEQIELLQDLPSITDELSALVSKGDTTVSAVEDRDAQFLLGVFNGG